ncbi:hypothetical protein BH23GEM9_BH23GEM9_20950 [soil metagenome]
MKWTIGRRIVAGFSVGAVLVIIITIIGVWALQETESSYAEAVQAEREILLTAVEARGAFRNANVSYLRYLVDPDAGDRAESTVRATSHDSGSRSFAMMIVSRNRRHGAKRYGCSAYGSPLRPR